MYSPQSQAVWFSCSAGESDNTVKVRKWGTLVSVMVWWLRPMIAPLKLPAKKPCNMGKVLIFRVKGQAMLEGDGSDPDVVGGDRSSLLSQMEEDGAVLLGGFFIDGKIKDTSQIFLSCSRVLHGNEENEEISLAYKIVYFGDQNIDNGTANISTAKGTTSRPAYNTIPRWNDCGSVSFR